MSDLLLKIKRHPKFPLAMAGLAYLLLTVTSAAALSVYFTDIAGSDFWHWQLISYIIMLGNGLTGFSEFFGESSFYPLRDLLDYCQLTLVLPCYAAEMWINTEMGPGEIATIHAGLGIIAVLMYIVTDRKRRDLTDLALFANAGSLIYIAAINTNLITLIATAIVITGYCMYKRQEPCCMAPADKFNFAMVAFAFFSFASFDDNIIQKIKPSSWG
ncbi:uncharacterized protein [Euwallacea fornicatus]|uniref:uncharacterized protein n=1 Tax=Euwallacea fornicatus TaxID=995702 RepID=UPI00338DCB2C